ncbi:putative vacuolar membrane transporter for cationic amino acids [Coemansia brasiliensis]|uniref:Vacuolar membrane transporter for cationic amino acids n=1 Tax=Coemansia brasiliensis TaxID=2650707 RepID=A0A9W8I8H0_9FUNG|nr:putative vacuolar membrane transporter for cationic amino acids [Coemansia brasiliensis]
MALVADAADPGEGFNMVLSTAIGYVSLACWMVVMFPQIYLNYQRKSGEGVSLVMMIAWVCGDIFNITGALMQDLVSSTVLIGSYYLFVDSTLLFQIIYYRVVYQAHRVKDQSDRQDAQALLADDAEDNSGPAGYAAVDENLCSDDNASSRDQQGLVSTNYRQKAASLPAILSLLLSLAALAILVLLLYALVVVPLVGGNKPDSDQGPNEPQPAPAPLPFSQIVAQMMGTASAVVYIMSYVPQAVQNYQRKSCEGLSIWLFLLSLLGNTTYAMAILVVSLDPQYLAPYVPWLLGALVPCLIQMFILYQFHTY